MGQGTMDGIGFLLATPRSIKTNGEPFESMYS
jgi:hypothetical protein